MTYTIDNIKEMLSKITQGEWEQCVIQSTGEYGVHVKDDPELKGLPDGTISNGLVICKAMIGPNKVNNSAFIASAPSIIRYLVGEVEKHNTEMGINQIPIMNEMGLEIERLQGEVERLDRAKDWFANTKSEVIDELFKTRERLAKYERVIEKAKAWTEYWQQGDMINDEFPLMSELQEALKQL